MIEITDYNFEVEILKCESIVFVCFIADWCQTCYPVCIVSSELDKEYNGKVKFITIDVEQSPKTARRYHISAIPTILIFRGSKPVKKIIGFQDRSYLRNVLNNISAESRIFH